MVECWLRSPLIYPSELPASEKVVVCLSFTTQPEDNGSHDFQFRLLYKFRDVGKLHHTLKLLSTLRGLFGVHPAESASFDVWNLCRFLFRAKEKVDTDRPMLRLLATVGHSSFHFEGGVKVGGEESKKI